MTEVDSSYGQDVETAEVTEVVTRHVKPGHDKDYADWFARMIQTIRVFPGYRGITAVVPGGSDRDARIVLYRFANKTSMEKWDNSPERRKLLDEVENYAIQVYTKATGLETWFELPNTHAVVPPPKWKMAIVTFVPACLVSYFSRLILGPYLGSWPLAITAPLFTAILVLVLTYFAMPNFTRVLRRWLYPGP